MCRASFAAVVLLLTSLGAAQAQNSSLVSRTNANRVGLEVAWSTRAQLDPARGRIAHITHHVSSTRAYTVFQVTHDGGEVTFSERDLDRFGEPIGKDEAEKRANIKVEDLERRDLNPKLTTETIPEISLYVMSDQGTLHVIDAESGRTRWTAAVGNPRYPSEAPAVNDEFVAVVNGLDLSVLDQEDGKMVWQRKMRRAPGAGPALSDELVFVSMLNGMVVSYRLNDHRDPAWVYRAHGRGLVQPQFTGSHVAWPTDRGYLYVAEANSQSILYRLETEKPIVAPPTPLHPRHLLVASTDGYVYCIRENSGRLQWQFSTGEPLVSAPVVVGDAVYVASSDDNLFRISADRGELQWSRSRISKVASASDQRLYCFSDTGQLSVLDPETGARIASLDIRSSDLQFSNRQTDRIFIGTRRGTIQCLRETGKRWPVIHAGVLKEKSQDAEQEEKDGQADAEREPEEEPSSPFEDDRADPFGGSSDEDMDDPFGGGDDPFGGDDGDPFGGAFE